MSLDDVLESSKVTLDSASNHVCIKVGVSEIRKLVLLSEEHMSMHLMGKLVKDAIATAV